MKIILIITLILYVIQKGFENYIRNNTKEAIRWNMNVWSRIGFMYLMFRVAFIVMLIISGIGLIIKIF